MPLSRKHDQVIEDNLQTWDYFSVLCKAKSLLPRKHHDFLTGESLVEGNKWRPQQFGL